jgi:hypothetical protein
MTKIDKDPLDVPIEDIELPPEHLDDELDNSGPDPSDVSTSEDAPIMPSPEMARLKFTTKSATREFTHPLEYPFELEIEGETPQHITEITVKRLTISEVGDTVRDGIDDYYDIYAAMTDLPAPVLRGLMDVDGNVVIGKCQDFFPQFLMKKKGSPPAPKTGEQ